MPTCSRSGSAGAAERPGKDWDQQALQLLPGLLPELYPNRSKDQPVQHPGDDACAKDKLLILRLRNVCLQHPDDVRSNLIEPGTEPIPSPRRIDSGARNDPNHIEVTTSFGQRADHRSNESGCQLLERRVGAQRAHGLLLSVQIPLESVFDRRVAQRFQGAEVVAHSRDVGVRSIGHLSERHTLLAVFGNQVQRGIHQSSPCSLACRAALVRPCFHG
jgi:hypothetical protein